MFKTPNLNVFIDLSTYCNAGCPQCHRTDTNGLGKVDWLPLIQWSLDEFQTAFPSDVLSQCRLLNICGTWGDPIMNRDIDQIVKYIVNNSQCTIAIDTNGSIRDEQWWWELGMTAGRQLEVIFAVDGIDQKMHQRYRRFTDLDTVLKNMRALSETKAVATAQTIQFKHNQDHTTQIKNLCMANGARSYRIVQSDRFYTRQANVPESRDEFIDENGQPDFLERATVDPPNSFISGTNGKRTLDDSITCRWQRENKIFINIDGQVLPCCYIGNNYYTKKLSGYSYNQWARHPVIAEYYDKQSDHNVFQRNLIDIVKHSKWFNHSLPNSWQDPHTAVTQCSRYCSAVARPKQQLKGYIRD